MYLKKSDFSILEKRTVLSAIKKLKAKGIDFPDELRNYFVSRGEKGKS